MGAGGGWTSDGVVDAARLIDMVMPPSGSVPFYIIPFSGVIPPP